MKVGPFARAYYAILEEPTQSSRGASSGATDPIALVAETWRSWLAVSDLNAAFAAVTQLSRLIRDRTQEFPSLKSRWTSSKEHLRRNGVFESDLLRASASLPSRYCRATHKVSLRRYVFISFPPSGYRPAKGDGTTKMLPPEEISDVNEQRSGFDLLQCARSGRLTVHRKIPLQTGMGR